jgi:enhancer of polycomb-like protein
VSTYEQDYRPNYRKSTTYLRGATFGAPPPETVEYDLDNDDEDWLEKYNDGQNRLPAEKLEIMMWKVRSIHWFPYDPVRVVNADP